MQGLKILFDGCDFVSRTGPNTFANRLARELMANGHIIADRDDYDVVLAFIEPVFDVSSYSKPIVQRLDGIWFKDQHEFLHKNARIRECYFSCDHIVWQSAFDREMIVRWWGEPKNGSIIGNGVKLEPLLDREKLFPEIAKIRADHEKVFVCSANWHGQKRLKKNVELFRYLQSRFYPTAGLVVLGSNAEMVAGKDIYYAGSVSHNICAQIYAIADWMIHLAWLDHCPNVVVECLMQGTPVICSEAGGTKELVGKFGIVLKEQVQYNFELVNYDVPPNIDFASQITEILPEPSTLGNHACIDIKKIAKDYVELFKEVLERDRRSNTTLG